MQTHLILGTMGHIDHGKTSLIAALNGFWGDGTPSEKERGITLDLSFSNLTQRDKNIAFIDAPGHEKLVKNMIAGAFGIDYALLVIAANEGVMPQTLEHLRIAYLLGIRDFIVVLSKCDLVKNTTLKKREAEIAMLFSNFQGLKYRLLNASIYDKTSIETLKSTLFSLPKLKRENLGFFRYYIDRSFSIKGLGCVVSGTLMDGDLSTQDKIWCCNLECNLNIKDIQSHNKNTKIAYNGVRVAINLQGISHHQLKRGYLLTKKGYLRGFDRIEVELESFSDVQHNSETMLYLGALRTTCRVLFLDSNKKFATLKTKIPLFSIFNERFILRDDTQTLGGGKVLSPIIDPMKKSQKLEYLKFLSNGDFKGAFSILLQAHKKGVGLIGTMQRFRIPQSKALAIAKEIPHCFVCEKALIAYPKHTRALVKEMIAKILAKNPNALLSATLLHQKQNFIAEEFAFDVLNELLAQKMLRKLESFFVSPKNSLQDTKSVEDYLYTTLYNALHHQGYAPLAPYNLYDSLDIDRKSGDAIFKRLTNEKKILRLSHKLFVCTEHLTKLLELMRTIIKKEGYLDLNNLKSHLNLSRKYLIAYLDYLNHFEDIENDNGKRRFK
ncbi:selenocysteine-specific translation elongation factor [Helicobacter sp.]|uniref:selenocysteine-specific translation elongation factor n=1 Tax=Helicobacter sp. TaxID=218 RepID=UPI0025BD8502|nr:selenocysteine-specific translation elongation factor [Helicobacter sp.]MCI5969271.1 selenocysteine-specific translation elongation factor [Helicobacter sp.]MDY2585526.1 selenocysteine-specific translation elongation factor [Helicobacter sp.]